MKKGKIYILIIVTIVIIISLLLIQNPKAFVTQDIDKFSGTTSIHWTHMPITYSIGDKCDREKIASAIKTIEDSTNSRVSFKEEENPDIKITCSYLENCYKNKTEAKGIWIVETETSCMHESGIAKITQIKGNKILKAEINLTNARDLKDNCTETELHELLHILGYSHSDNTQSIMYPMQKSGACKENIDPEITQDLIRKYSTL